MASESGPTVATAAKPASGSDGAAEAADGRLARGERTRRALAEALIGLLEEGDARPTARRIAARAGVSLRLVYHHFEDVESILRAAVAIQEQRHWRHIRPVEPALPLAERVAGVVRQRTGVFQAVAPVRRAAEAMADSSPTIAGELARARSRLRAQLRATFAPELDRGTTPSAASRLDVLEVATSWETWEQLQRMGRGAAACRRTMELLATAAVGGPTGTGGRT
ncbi:MAG TPA: TetR family transcriptional regulator [Acidimicrobiales bacterium]|nr:TetR family transcriptional regulator [Acidimicrobiales bacterium]